eukprot:4522087-Alexandrium_andersonii.AAC.1
MDRTMPADADCGLFPPQSERMKARGSSDPASDHRAGRLQAWLIQHCAHDPTVRAGKQELT